MHDATITTRKAVLFYPPFGTVQELAEQYHRLTWYLPANGPYDAYLLHEPGLNFTREGLDTLLPEYLAESNGCTDHIHFAPWSPSFFTSLASRAVTVGLWRTPSARMLDKLSILAGRRFVVLDPFANGTWEFARYATIQYDHMRAEEKGALRSRSMQLLSRAYNDLKHLGKAYVFGTGPSLARAAEFDFSDGVRIVCNSIVRNPELLAHIRPHFIAASDFVFHFGPSRYAAEFRRDLTCALAATDAFLLIPDQCAPLMFSHFPEIANRTIAVPISNRFDLFASRRGVNVQLLDRFEVMTLDSVLNLLMLPLASTIADEIYILGCDGRKNADIAFWSHHNASQYESLMSTVNLTHPGFFSVNYVDYYNRYCTHLALVVAAGEAIGKRYSSLTPSLVPALSTRPAFAYTTTHTAEVM